MITKTCKKCCRALDIEQFYVHAQMSDGHLGFCKECVKERVRQHRSDNIESVRQYDRFRGKLPHRLTASMMRGRNATPEQREQVRENRRKYESANKEKVLMLNRQWAKENGNKRKAHNTLNNAIRAGKIIKPQACECGNTGTIHGHHTDYSKPLDVVWLCALCHGKEHWKKDIV